MYKEVINLIAITQGKDLDGFPAEVPHLHEVFANKKSVARSEFYASYQVGINATAVFETRLCDFEEAAVIDEQDVKHKPTQIEHDGDKYKIVRTYAKDDETIELTCSDLGA